jgi:hypothetical protein
MVNAQRLYFTRLSRLILQMILLMHVSEVSYSVSTRLMETEGIRNYYLISHAKSDSNLFRKREWNVRLSQKKKKLPYCRL